MNETSRQKLVEFFSNYRLDTYKKRQIILKPGEDPNYIGFIKSGFVRVYTTNSDGEEVTIQMFKPMLFFTVLFSRTGLKNRYYFEAITPVEMWKAPREEASKFFGSNMEVANEIMKDFFERFLMMSEQLSSGLAGKAKSKVAGALLSLQKAFHGDTEEVAITHKLIASMTGMTRETVTLQMLKLEKEKVIDNKNRSVKVLKTDKLKEISGGEAIFSDEG